MTTIRILRNLASENGSVLRFQVKNFEKWLTNKKHEWRKKGFALETKSNNYYRQGHTSVRLIAYKDGIRCFAVMV